MYYNFKRVGKDGGTLLFGPVNIANDGDAATVAQSLSTLLGVSLQLQGGTLTAPYTTYTPGSQTSPGTVPCVSGVGVY